ncbi:cytochrome P450 2J4-like [Littorina saxatilis]|uniref:cytochrome P450 2J4-like n=1 Tax=Littorina saxatilis TaxID=31220 RepID=UPI0038B42BD5
MCHSETNALVREALCCRYFHLSTKRALSRTRTESHLPSAAGQHFHLVTMGRLDSSLLDTTTLLAGSVLSLTVLWWLSTRRPSDLPPGPGPALPVIGHLHLLSSDPRAAFRTWRRQYGDVFSLYMGGRLVVVLNGLPVIKEALVKMADVFSHRPHMFITDRITNQKGIVSSSGALWKEQRKTALEILRELGMGKNVLAEKIQEEITYYIRAIEDHQEAPVDLSTLTHITVSNNICSIIFGKRFDYDDPAFRGYLRMMEENMKAIGASAIINYMPMLEYLPGDLFKIKLVVRRATKFYDFVQQHISEHRTERSLHTENTDFIHSYLTQGEQLEDSNVENTLDNENLLNSIADLFVAGTESTATAILWTLLFFLHYPKVQDKCFKEISDVIGSGRAPTMQDRPKLQYLEATIMEVLRRADMVPISVPHGLADDVTFRGYVIPKDAIVLPNLESVLLDPEIWGDPDNFRPERFICPDGKVTRPEEFIPFGIGRRVCLGESLARMELFLYLSTLIQRFRFLPPEQEPLPSLEGIMGFSLSPAPFKVRAIPRQ